MTEPGEMTDAQAVRAVLAGDQELYRVLVRRYQDILFRHAVRMVDSEDDAADIVQRALVRGFRKLGRCKDPSRFGGWLFRIASNLCKDHLKSPRREDFSIEGSNAEVYHEETPDRDAERSEARARLSEALERLGPEQREAFTLKHLKGLSYDEMASVLSASKSALKMRVHRAREELRDLLGVPR